MNRIIVFLYGTFSYLLGVSALVGWILSMLGLLEFQAGPVKYTSSFPSSIAIAIGLTFLFAVQHTIMAREKFKNKLAKIIPLAAERSTFVLFTGIVVWIVILFWPVNSTLVWQIENPTFAFVINALAVAAWGYLFLASFAINHLELFGIEQSFNYLRRRETPTVPFVERFMYKYDRHPIMTGALLGMWITPTMTVDHFMFSTLFTLYIIFGVSLEERELIKQWGEGYLDYKKRVRSIVPTF